MQLETLKDTCICQQITYFPTLGQNASPEAHNLRPSYWNSIRMGTVTVTVTVTVTASKTSSFAFCACRKKKGCVLNHASTPPDVKTHYSTANTTRNNNANETVSRAVLTYKAKESNHNTSWLQ